MKTKLISAALAATLAVTSFAAPAQANERDVAKFIVGATALAIIAGALSQNNGNVSVSTGNRYGHDRDRYDYDRGPQKGHHGRVEKPNPVYQPPVKPRPNKPRQAYNKVLPNTCAFEIGNNRTVLGKACLNKSGTNVRALPARCEFAVRTNRGPRDVYGAYCLSGYGYQIARR